MVNCQNCGTKNEDDSEYCSKCGEPLKGKGEYDKRHYRNDYRYRQRNECFGLPHGNLIAPIVAGVVLILLGLSSLYGFAIWTYIWPALIILIGILIILGAIFGSRRRYRR
jgi:uncharacterized membrane protein YvbJ